MTKNTWLLLAFGISWIQANQIFIKSPIEGELILGNKVQLEMVAPVNSEIQVLGKSQWVDESGRISVEVIIPDTLNQLDLRVLYKGKSYQLSRSLTRKEVFSKENTSLSDKWWLLPVFTQDSNLLISKQWLLSLGAFFQQRGLTESVLFELPQSANLKCGMSCLLKEAQSLNMGHLVQPQLLYSNDWYMWKLSLWDVKTQKELHQFSSKNFKSKGEVFENLLSVGSDLRDWKQSQNQVEIVSQKDSSLSDTTILSGVLPAVLKSQVYKLRGVAIVPEGRETIIDSGVQILAEPNAALKVFGSLKVNGTKDQMVQMRLLDGMQGTWAGIQVESNQPLKFNYTYISHARVGIHGVSSNIWLDETQIDHSAVAAIMAENSDLHIQGGGVQLAKKFGIVLNQFSFAQLNLVTLKDNEVAVLVNQNSSLEMNASQVSNNKQAFLMDKDINFKLVRSKVQGNQAGLVFAKDKGIPKSQVSVLLNGFAGSNTNDLSEISQSQYDLMLLPLGLNNEYDTPLYRKSKFKSDIQFVPEEEVALEWLGTVQYSVDYQSVDPATWDSPRPTLVQKDTIKQGQQLTNRFQIPGFNHRINVYMNRQDSIQKDEISLDLWQNEWNSVRMNPFTLNFERSNHAFTLGDFRSNIHELVQNGSNVLGARYHWRNQEDLRKVAGVHWELFAGELDRPHLEGTKDIDVYGNYYGVGASKAQRLAYGTRMSLGSLGSNYSDFGFLSVWDTRESLLRDPIPVSVDLSTPMVQSKNIYINNQFKMGPLQIKPFVAFGVSDTTEGYRQKAVEKWLLIHNIIEEADTLRKLLLKKDVNSATISFVLPKSMTLTPKQVIQQVDSLENTEKGSRAKEKSLGSFQFDAQDLAFNLNLELQFAKSRWTLETQYTGNRYFSASMPVQNQRKVVMDGQWSLAIINQNLRIKFQEDYTHDGNDFVFGTEEGDLWGTQTWSEKPFSSRNALNPNPRYEFEEVFENKWNINDLFDWTLSYQNTWSHQIQEKIIRKDTTLWNGIYLDPYFTPQNSETTLKMGNTQISEQKWNDYLAQSDTLASLYQQRWMDHKVRMDLRFKKKEYSVKLGVQYQLRSDESKYHKQSHWFNDLSKDVLANLSYIENGDAWWSLKFPISVQSNFEFLPVRADFYLGQKTWVRNHEIQQDMGMSLNFKKNLIPGRLDFELQGNTRVLQDEKDMALVYFEDANKVKYSYYRQDELGNIIPLTTNSATAQDVQPGIKASGFELRKESSTKTTDELDWSIIPSFKVGINENWNMSLYGLYEEKSRPQSLTEDYRWWKIGSSLSCTF